MRAPIPRRVVRLAGGPLLMLAIIATLHHLGSGVLAPPPLGSLGGVAEWAASRDAPTIGLAGFRLIALVVAYHLVATTSLALLGRLIRWPGVARLAERATLPPFRSAVRHVAGLAISASTILSSAALPASTASAAVELPGPNTPTMATLRLVSQDQGPSSVEPKPATTATLRQVQPVQPQVSSVQPASGPLEHLVRPGDHLWSIAEQRLATGLGRQPTEPEVTAYWLAVVAANPQLLHPDLLYTGDPVHLPALLKA